MSQPTETDVIVLGAGTRGEDASLLAGHTGIGMEAVCDMVLACPALRGAFGEPLRRLDQQA